MVKNLNNSHISLKNLHKEFVLHHHLGLGDSIICNGLVNYLSTKYEKIHLPVKSSIYKMIDYLYSENPKVQLFEIENDTREKDISNYANQNSFQILRIGYDEIKNTPFHLAFYNQLRIPYRYTYKYLYLPNSENMEVELKDYLINYYGVNPKNYSLVHNEYQWPGGSFDLEGVNNRNSIFVTKDSDIYKNLFLYKKIIEDATTIHCINGSFLHLVERVKTKAKKYYHHTRKNNLHLANNWTFVDYED